MLQGNRLFAALMLASLALAAPLHCSAANWQVIGSSKEVVAYVDTDSIRRSGDRVKTWLKWEWASQEEVPDSVPRKVYRSEKQLQVSDCKNRTLAIAQGIRYAEVDGGAVVDSYSVNEKQWQFREAAPDTIGESIVRFACSFGKSKSK